MDFATSISTVFRKYAVFSGRARRSEYWWFALFLLIVDIVVDIVDAVAGTSILGILVFLATVLPALAVGIRRLHDTSRTGWWVFIGLIPLVGTIILIVFLCQDSAGGNQYGESPKYGGGGPYGQGGYGQGGYGPGGYGPPPGPGGYGPPQGPGGYGPPQGPGQYGQQY